ncbi:hypothetical protein BGZ94_009285 [Podila epigama]|nr:hypothetical protein BGZ94_009285 [Podila epigama]
MTDRDGGGGGAGSGGTSESGWSFYSWRSMLPGYRKKEEQDEGQEETQDQGHDIPKDESSDDKADQPIQAAPNSQNHQITDYQEGDRKDIHGNTIHFGQPANESDTTPIAQDSISSSSPSPSLSSLALSSLPSSQPVTLTRPVAGSASPTISSKSTSSGNTSVVKDVGQAVSAASKALLKRKNVVLPNYYEQFPHVCPSLILQPMVPSIEPSKKSEESSLVTPSPPRGRFSTFVKSAVDTFNSFFFSSKATTASVATTAAAPDPIIQGPNRIRKVVIFGIHGWFPTKLVRTVIGEPTGTSKKFCDEMELALKDYLRIHNVDIPEEDITLIPLEGEGKVLDRVDILYNNLIRNPSWRHATANADLVLVATHSQGTPTSIMLVARLIQEGLLRVDMDDPRMQRIGILTMAGISHGPFPFLKGNLIVRWFEAEAAGELFEFMDSESTIARRYREGLKVVLSSGVRLTCVASLEDQVVPLYSAVMTSIYHPSIVRAVYIDGNSYQKDFLTQLISFALRLRNAGLDDHGVLVHLSEVIAGSLYGEGHSTIYDEREVYMLAIRSLLEPPVTLTPELARSEPVLHAFRARQRLNPFYLPWGMRGMAEDIKARGDEGLAKGLEELRKLYSEWNPVTKGMKEIKYRLEPVRSKL